MSLIMIMSGKHHRVGDENEIRRTILIESPKETLKNYLGSEGQDAK